MTELMKQLQPWANEGALIFPCEEYPNGAVKAKNGILHTYMIHEHLQHVLDGTIQVWRPVEHYAQPLNGVYLGWNGKLKCYMLCNSGGDVFTREFGMIDVTHWQPLAQPPQKGGEG